MKRRKSKKTFAPGILITVHGTSCVFMSLGMKSASELDSFNGFNIATGQPVTKCDGRVRIATRKESTKYWSILIGFIKNGQENKQENR